MSNVTRRKFGSAFTAALLVGTSVFALHAAQAQELKGREIVLGAIVPKQRTLRRMGTHQHRHSENAREAGEAMPAASTARS